jgi:hypothetical protein
VDANVSSARMCQHRTLLIDQELAGSATKPFGGADQPLIRGFGVLASVPPEGKRRETLKGVHDDVNRGDLTGDHRQLGRPITLDLTPGVRLEPDRRPAGSESPPGSE